MAGTTAPLAQHAAAIAYFAGICEAEMELSVTEEASFLSLHSFILPTADWFVSISDFELCQVNEWITSARIPLFPYSEGNLEVPDCMIHDVDSEEQDLLTLVLPANSSMWVDDDMCARTHPLSPDRKVPGITHWELNTLHSNALI